MEFMTGVAVGALGLAAWRGLGKSAVAGGLAAAGHTRSLAGTVKDQVVDVVQQARADQKPAPEPSSPPKKASSARKKPAG